MMVDAPPSPSLQIRPPRKRSGSSSPSSDAAGSAAFVCFIVWVLVLVPWLFVRYGRYENIRDACTREVGADVVAFHEEEGESSCRLTLQWKDADNHAHNHATNFSFTDAPTVCVYSASAANASRLPTPFPQRTCYREDQPQNLRLMGCMTEEAKEKEKSASKASVEEPALSSVMWAHYPGWSRRHRRRHDSDAESCEEMVVSPTDVRDARRASLALFIIMMVFAGAAFLFFVFYVIGGLDGIVAVCCTVRRWWARSSDSRDSAQPRPPAGNGNIDNRGGDVSLLPREFVRSDA